MTKQQREESSDHGKSRMNKEEKIKIMGNIIMKHFLSSLEFLKLYLIAEAKKKKLGGPHHKACGILVP